MATKVCVVGCGAIGSVFAAHLVHRGGLDVFVYDKWQEHVHAIRERGLRISGAADMVAKVNATTQPTDIPLCDVGIFATKSIHTAAAAEETAHLFQGPSVVISVQNGLGNEEMIARYVGQVMRGVTSMAANVIEPGHVELESHGNLHIGPFEPTATPYPLVEQVGRMITAAGLPCVPLRDAAGAQWTKVIFNSAVNPVAGLTGLHHGALVRFGPTSELCEALLLEGEAVAEAMGITLHGDPRDIVVKGASGPIRRRPSMLIDVLAGRQTEVDFVNGAIADRGEALNVPVPLNRALWRLLKGLEHSWTAPA